MAINDNAKLEYEAGVTPYSMAALTDFGDHKKFTSSATYFSEASGSAPVILPNGLINGGAIIQGVSGTNNKIDVATLLLNLNGVETTVAGSADITVTRAATNVASITSVTISNAGAIVLVKGTDSATTAFSETRAAAGGPPLIAVDSVEIAQVRTTSNTAAKILASEIYAIAGTHMESAFFPVYGTDNFTATVNFETALPLIHTGVVAKKVYASYADPIFSEIKLANDFVAPQNSTSVSSTQVYQDTVGSSSKSLGAGSFTAILRDGITDPIMGRIDNTLMFRFYQDKYKNPHVLCQGTLSGAISFNASDNPQGTFTIAALKPRVNRAS
jgi:hypothetical protein